jgi:hypothetical protein
MNTPWLLELTTFLCLAPERTWLAEVLPVLSTRGKYTHSAFNVEHYKQLLDQHFAEYPQVYENLHKFVEPLPVEGSTAIEEDPVEASIVSVASRATIVNDTRNECGTDAPRRS